MNGDIIIGEETLDDFIKIITSSYDNFVSSNSVFRWYAKIVSFLKPLHQIKKLIKSKKNVAHHYDFNEDLYKLFLDKNLEYSCVYFYNQNIDLNQTQVDKKNILMKNFK